jgi:hypothetical protein
MKTKTFFTTTVQFKSWFIAGLLGIATFLGQAHARNISAGDVFLATEEACPAADYTAMTSLPEGVTSSANVTVIPQFSGLSGFQNANLDAYIDPSEMMLHVTLSGFANDNLPINTVIGTVIVTDNGVSWTFVVIADGGSLVIGEQDI